MKASLSFLGKFDFIGLLLLRIGAGATIAFYGWPFLIGGAEAWKDVGRDFGILSSPEVYQALGLASGLIQVICGLAIVVGTFTRSSALLIAIVIGFRLSGMMQTDTDLIRIFLAAQIGLTFLSLVFLGPGRISLDRRGI